MTEITLWKIFGVVSVVVFGLISLIWKLIVNRVNRLDDKIESVDAKVDQANPERLNKMDTEIQKLRDLRHGLRKEMSILSGKVDLQSFEWEDHKLSTARTIKAIKTVIAQGLKQLKHQQDERHDL